MKTKNVQFCLAKLQAKAVKVIFIDKAEAFAIAL